MTPPPADAQLLDDAVKLARRAGRHTLGWFQRPDLVVEQKGDGSPVTEADRSTEALIRSELAARYPHDAVVGEEHPPTEGTTGRVWFVDPIDGTRSFARGVPLYTTLLAVSDDHGPAVGVCYVPGLDEMVYAGRGWGCFHNGRRCQVSRHDRLAGAYLTSSGLEYWSPGIYDGLVGTGAILRTWGDGYGYVLLATGRVEAMIDPGLSPWDVAPMRVIVSEAGGEITGWDGNRQPAEGDVIATNGAIHEALLARLSTR